jgi:hypothetical protein
MVFQPPPPGQSFDVEWGFVPGFHGLRNRDWRICSRDEIRDFLFHDIGEDIHSQLDTLAKEISFRFANVRDQALDVLEFYPSSQNPRRLIATSVELGITSFLTRLLTRLIRGLRARRKLHAIPKRS